MNEVCLTLLSPPEIEESLLDELLMNPTIKMFTSQRAARHGGHLTGLDPREQVLGRSDAVLIQALLNTRDAEELLAGLRPRFRASGVQFWMVPVLGQGEL